MDADNKKIWCNGQFVEVSSEVYSAYMKGDRKARYFENDLKTERVLLNEDGTIKQIVPSREDSLDRLMDDNAEQFLANITSIEDTVLESLSSEKLHKAISCLRSDEQRLIVLLFFEDKTERDIAAMLGVSQPAIHKRKNKILEKLRILFEN